MLCRVPDKWPSAKSLFAVKFFSEGSLPRAALGKAFAEGFWAFAECPGPSAKRASPVVKEREEKLPTCMLWEPTTWTR